MNEITPQDMRCWSTDMCSAIFDNGDSYAIIGKIIPAHSLGAGLAKRIGPGECMIVVPKKLIDEKETAK